MPQIRRATLADAETISDQRLRMFIDAGHGHEYTLAPMIALFTAWVKPRLKDETYLGWIVEEDSRPVAGIGAWLMDYPPNFRDPAGIRAYLMNMYVAPEMRRRGFGRQLVEIALAETRSRGIKVTTLHATPLGRLLYEQCGFKPTSEMMLQQQP